MNCKSTVEMLSAYLDRELGATERNAVRVHLAECDRCRADERELRALKGLLLGVRAPEPTPDFETRLMARLHSEASSPSLPRFSLPRLRPVIIGQFGGMALAAALAVVVVTHGTSPRRVNPAPSPRLDDAVARADDQVYAQHSEAYHLAADNAYGAPLLSP